MDYKKVVNSLAQPTVVDPAVIEPYKYIRKLASNNNNVRSRFINAFNETFFHITDQEVLQLINEVIEILHNASLLIDDVEDSSNFRRGYPSAHMKYGVPLTINCGNLMYFEAIEKVYNLWRLKLGKEDTTLATLALVWEIVMPEMKNFHKGQGLDIYWRDNLPDLESLPSVVDYCQMAKDKTGGLFRLAVRLLRLFSSGSTHLDSEYNGVFESIANCLGVIYQIRDDYLNIVDERYSHMKGIRGEDLIEGKLSFPILVSLTKDFNQKHTEISSLSPLYDLLYNHRSTEERLRRRDLHDQAIEHLESPDIVSETNRLLQELKAQACRLITENSRDANPLMIMVDTLCTI